MTRAMFTPIESVSKKNRVVERLKEVILSGALLPGDAIIESKISAQIGVGTPLIREALIELEHQGFVRKIPYKGTFVTRLSQNEIEQIYRLRMELEALAFAWAKENTTPADITTLRDLLEEMRQNAKKLKLAAYYECDLNFHRKLWQMSGNTYLVEALERIVVPLFAFSFMRTERERASYVNSVENHRKLLDDFCRLTPAEIYQLTKDSLAGWKAEMLARAYPDNQSVMPQG